jgi:hypothetical protein
MLVDAGLQAGVEAHLDAGLTQPLHGVAAEVFAHLREDAPRRLDQDPAHVGRAEVGVVAGSIDRHVLQLGQRLHARVAAADEQERQQPPALVGAPDRVGQVQLAEHLVAQRDGLLHLLEADAVLGEAGNRQRARDRPGSDDHDVVPELVRLAGERLDHGEPAGVLDARHPAGQHLDVVQHAAQRHDDVPRLDAARRRLGEERLVRHVRPRVDHGHPRLARAQLPLQPQGGVHADVAAADHENVRAHLAAAPPAHALALLITSSSIAAVSLPVKVFC